MKKLFAAIAFVLGAVMTAEAQTSIRNESMVRNADFVTVTFDVDTDQTDLPHLRKEVILP